MDFWAAAIGTNDPLVFGAQGILLNHGGYYLYYRVGLHGVEALRVSSDDVYAAVLRDKVGAWIARVALEGRSAQLRAAAHAVLESPSPANVDRLLLSLWHVRRLRWCPDGYTQRDRYFAIECEQVVEEAWQRYRLSYWRLAAFETVFLSLLVVVPGVTRGRRFLAVSTCAAVGYLPYVLGYCLVVPSFGPRGGILYPWIVAAYHCVLSPIPENPLDAWAYASLPKPFLDSSLGTTPAPLCYLEVPYRPCTVVLTAFTPLLVWLSIRHGPALLGSRDRLRRSSLSER